MELTMCNSDFMGIQNFEDKEDNGSKILNVFSIHIQPGEVLYHIVFKMFVGTTNDGNSWLSLLH